MNALDSATSLYLTVATLEAFRTFTGGRTRATFNTAATILASGSSRTFLYLAAIT